MKNLLLLTLTLILFGFTGIAQVNLDNYSFNPEIKEASRLMSKGETNSYSIIIDGLSRKEVEKSWGKFMKNCDSKCKWDKNTKEFLADDAEIESISDNTIDVYSQLIESNNRVEMIVWMDLGGGFLSTSVHGDRSKAGEEFIMKFAYDMEKKRVDNFQKKEEDKLEGMQKDMKNLKKDKIKLEDKIVDFQRKIEEANQDITENVNKQPRVEKEISTQKAYVGQVEGDDLRKKEEKKLKDLEGNLKGLKKDKKKQEKNIESYYKKIEKSKQKIAENVENQDLKQNEIKAQGDYIEKVKAIKTTLGN